MQNILRLFLSIASTLLLMSCQAGLSFHYDSSRYAPPVESKLVLNSPIDFSPYQLNHLIQDGKVLESSWKLDQYRAHCDFELYNKSREAVRIQPDTFVVTRVVLDSEHVMLAPGNVADIGFSSGPPFEEYQTYMYLHSDKQPNVRLMTCKHWVDPAIDSGYLSLEEIRQALGELFTLEIAGK